MGKDTIYYVVVVLALIAFAAAIVFGFRFMPQGSTNHNTNNTGTNKITILASGTVSNISTQAYMYVIINGTGATNHLAVQNISANLKKFNSTIYKYLNGNLSKITTNYFNVYKLYNATTGYQAEEGLTVTIPSISNVSSLIDALSNITGVFVTGASPTLSNRQISMMREQALSLAMANATSQAQALIGTNNTVYSTNITVNNYYIFPYRTYGAASEAVSAGSGTVQPIYMTNFTITPQFYGGTNKVTESVTVVFTYGRKV